MFYVCLRKNVYSVNQWEDPGDLSKCPCRLTYRECMVVRRGDSHTSRCHSFFHLHFSVLTWAWARSPSPHHTWCRKGTFIMFCRFPLARDHKSTASFYLQGHRAVHSPLIVSEPKVGADEHISYSNKYIFTGSIYKTYLWRIYFTKRFDFVFWSSMQLWDHFPFNVTFIRGLGGRKKEAETQVDLKFQWAWLVRGSLLLYVDPFCIVFALCDSFKWDTFP